MNAFVIGRRQIGGGAPCFVIAEAGVNHNGDLDSAVKLVEAAAGAGADAVKFQTFRADRLVVPAARKAPYQERITGSGSQFDMLRQLELPASAFTTLRDRCHALGITFLSTPFEEESADLLERLGVEAFKIPSGELTNLPLIQHIGRKRKPVILSTGMATLAETESSVQALRQVGCREMAVLHCTSSYPTAPADANLRAIQTLRDKFDVPAGYSDHTIGRVVPLAAVALGACIIEKHFTLDRSLPGPDHQASCEPLELAGLIHDIRTVEAALGSAIKVPTAAEIETAASVRKSLVAVADIPAGAEITDRQIGIMRPGTGLPPAMRDHVIGKRARVPIAEGCLIALEMLE